MADGVVIDGLQGIADQADLDGSEKKGGRGRWQSRSGCRLSEETDQGKEDVGRLLRRISSSVHP